MKIFSNVSIFVFISTSLILTSCSFSTDDLAKEVEDSKCISLAIQPMGPINLIDVQGLSDSLQRRFPWINFHILPASPLPNNAFYSKRNRYRADTLLNFLISHDHNYNIILGVTEQDISISKRNPDGSIKYRDFGIFGLGKRPNRIQKVSSSVVSSFRLSLGSHSDILEKVCIHEIGHNLGLAHCETPSCIMADANEKLSTVKSANSSYCSECAAKIRRNIIEFCSSKIN
jgi:archaemetzincin